MKDNLANFTGSKKIESSLIFDGARYSLASLCSAVVSRWPEGFAHAELSKRKHSGIVAGSRFPEDDPNTDLHHSKGSTSGCNDDADDVDGTDGTEETRSLGVGRRDDSSNVWKGRAAAAAQLPSALAQ